MSAMSNRNKGAQIVRAVLLTTVLLAAILASCASQYPAMLQQSTLDATQMKTYANSKAPKAPMVLQGDSLYAAAQVLAAAGKTEEAYYLMDKAALTYKLASSLIDADENKAQADALRKALAKVQDQLNAYQKVLQEVEAVK